MRHLPADRLSLLRDPLPSELVRVRAASPLPRPVEQAEAQPSAAAQALVESYRLHGYRCATMDPLGVALREPLTIDELDPRRFGLRREDTTIFGTEFAGQPQAFSIPQLIEELQEIYCGTLALDCGHVRALPQRTWLHAQMEERWRRPATDAAQLVRTFEQLVAAECYERYQRAAYPRAKQFSLEGCESLVPLMEALLETSAEHGAEDVVIGMPHRGRLNLLLNVFGLTPRQLLSLFCGPPDPSLAAWDLKDHLGCATRRQTAHGEVSIRLAHNPSHLGAVTPVVCGMARALQERKPEGSVRKVVPVLMHGDAAFPGQGIVAETLNLSQTRGYAVGGTIHVIVNNQIGSTISDPRDSRSTMHCADLARAIDAPIVHVNADDPEAVVTAGRMCAAFRARFAADIIVDLVGYRRQGHFGGDDPTVTQPATQRRIREHPSAPRLFADTLATRGVHVDYEHAKAAATARLAAADVSLRDQPFAEPGAESVRVAASRNARATTAVPVRQLRRIVERHLEPPPQMLLHADVRNVIDKWHVVAVNEEQPLDWCLAENLAYGSLLATGFNVRLAGLDVGRGSFFHRYAVWHDQRAEQDGRDLYIPLRHLGAGQGHFAIFESPLSEEAVLGFEYGYALHCGRDLVVWEAQFGDF